MAALAPAGQAPGQQEMTGWYVYGIVPGDVEVAADTPGVGDPPGPVSLVRHGGVAALVSQVSLGGLLGTPEDLRTHAHILDATAAVMPVLPLRFGAVMTSQEAVTGELLAAHHEQFAAALTALEGKAEYLVKGRYVEHVVLAEVLSEIPHAERLRQQIRGKDETATQPARTSTSGRSSTRRSPPSAKPTPRSSGMPWPRSAWPVWSGSRPTNMTPST